MKIIILLSCLEMGGAERQAFYLAKYLKSKGEDVEVVGITSIGKLTEILDKADIPWKFIKFDVKPKFTNFIIESLRFAWQLRKEKADVILSYTLIPNVVGALIWKYIGVKLFVWNQRDEGFDECNRRAMKMAFQNTKYFLSNSVTGADYLIKKSNIPAEKVQIINNSYYAREMAIAKFDFHKEYQLDKYNFVANMVGNLSQVKDHITLIKAWKIITDELNGTDINPLLFICGRFDAMADKVKALISELHLNESVILLGGIDPFTGLYDVSDAFLYSSLTEGSPNVVMEAMMAKLPIVASDIPSIRYILQDTSESYLAIPQDPADFAEKTLKLINNPVERKRLGEANYQKANELFDPETNLDKMYDYILEKYGKK
jgi:glycosyltransferase involved in cell wall biosynthesis